MHSPADFTAASYCHADENDKPQRREVLSAGLEWLLRTEQPDGVMVTHHGFVIHARGRRAFGFSKHLAGSLVTVEVTRPVFDELGELTNPMTAAEVTAIGYDLHAAGVSVVDSWNGAGTSGASFHLKEAPHPSFTAALELFNRGCPYHPSGGVQCGCQWSDEPRHRIVLPAVASGVSRTV